MKRLLCLCILLVGCEVQVGGDQQRCPDGKCPTARPHGPREVGMNPPMNMRMHNYAGGSCGWASLSTNLNWLNKEKAATYVRRHKSGGSYVGKYNRSNSLPTYMDRLNLDYALEQKGNESFLHWASKTRRGAVIEYYPNHIVNFSKFQNGYAYLIDNNSPKKFRRVPYNHFVPNWRRYGGVALTPMYAPPPPRLK